MLEEDGWEVVKWSASGGYSKISQGDAKDMRHRERMWVSPSCNSME